MATPRAPGVAWFALTYPGGGRRAMATAMAYPELKHLCRHFEDWSLEPPIRIQRFRTGRIVRPVHPPCARRGGSDQPAPIAQKNPELLTSGKTHNGSGGLRRRSARLSRPGTFFLAGSMSESDPTAVRERSDCRPSGLMSSKRPFSGHAETEHSKSNVRETVLS